ncbi:MAG: hypothetical protein SF053_15985 [Bacteroidia bacterium]|nr:hypothetical protein [Bacteroidia bacterium]
MKFFTWILKLLLLLNTLFELGVALVMIAAPVVIIPQLHQTGEAIEPLLRSLTRLIGFGTLAIAVLSGLMVTRNLSPEVKFAGFGALAVFHLGMTASQVLNNIDGLSSIPVVIIHGVFALVFLALFLWHMGQKTPAPTPAA